VIVTHLTTVVFLYQKHNPEDGWIAGRNMLGENIIDKNMTYN
jgi:hypothetical protein